MTEENLDEDITKVEYDARQQYYIILRGYLANIASASAMGEHSAWLRLLRGMFNLVNPFISRKDSEYIKKQMVFLSKQRSSIDGYRINEKQLQAFMDDRLNEITEKLYMSCRHLLVPVRMATMDDFDEDEFLRQSGK